MYSLISNHAQSVDYVYWVFQTYAILNLKFIQKGNFNSIYIQ